MGLVGILALFSAENRLRCAHSTYLRNECHNELSIQYAL
jgi:hypothetical protein